MNIIKRNKAFTVIGVIAALMIAYLLSITVDPSTFTASDDGLARPIIAVIAIRAIVFVLLIWAFFERAIQLLDRFYETDVFATRFAKSKIKIITWYLVFEIIMLITFI